MTTAQLIALRALVKDGTQPERKSTGRVLVRYGFARESKDGGFFHTERGKAWIEDYVKKTGDGPEYLKAMFRW